MSRLVKIALCVMVMVVRWSEYVAFDFDFSGRHNSDTRHRNPNVCATPFELWPRDSELVDRIRKCLSITILLSTAYPTLTRHVMAPHLSDLHDRICVYIDAKRYSHAEYLSRHVPSLQVPSHSEMPFVVAAARQFNRLIGVHQCRITTRAVSMQWGRSKIYTQTKKNTRIMCRWKSCLAAVRDEVDDDTQSNTRHRR